MDLKNQFEKQGIWLFKWRSYLPLLLLPLLIFGLYKPTPSVEYKESFLNELSEMLSYVVSFSGFLIRCLIVGSIPEGTSGRNRSKQIAKSLNTTGIYSLVRNPLYLGNYLMFLGVFLFAYTGWGVLIFSLLFWLYYERIIFAEEEFLKNKFGNVFTEWAEKTPAFIPSFKNWQPSSLEFSIKNVLKREYSGFFGLVVTFTLIEVIEDYLTRVRFN